MSNDGTGAAEQSKSSSASSREMCGDGTEEDSGSHKVPVNKKLLRSAAAANELLLPGLPEEITLNHIATKLPCNAFQVLSSVNSCWRQAIRSHKVFEERVRSGRTETFAVLQVHPTNDHILALYSTRDKSCRYLPAIPAAPDCVSVFKLISMEGKLYALGGEGRDEEPDGQVYVLDIAAGESLWTQLARNPDERDHHGFGAVDGKIYAFCGWLCEWPEGVCQVYDPHEDAWAEIKPYFEERHPEKHDYQVATIGKELFLYGGYFADIDNVIQYAEFLDIYHPIKDEWRRVESFMHHDDIVFMARGRFHRVSSRQVEVHDLDKNSWTPLQSNSFASIERLTLARVEPIAALYVKDEIILVVHLCRRRRGPEPFLLQSMGFGSHNKVIMWEKTHIPLPVERWGLCDAQMCSIEL